MSLPKPEISREEAMKLWVSEHSDYAKGQVILNNTGLIVSVLKSLNLNPLDEDLFATGLVGLVKAVNTFDSNKANAFSSYAIPVIRNEFLKMFRKKRIAPDFSLDEPYNLENGEDVPYAEMIADSRRFEEEVIADMQFEGMLKYLDGREKEVIFLKMSEKRQREIGRILGITQGQVSNVIKNIHKKWRKINGI